MMRIKRLFQMILILCVCGGMLGIYGFRVEPHLLTVKTHELETSGEDEMVRLVQISDIQVSENFTVEDLRKLVERVNEQKPDIFLFTGDLFENFAVCGPKEEVTEVLSGIEAPLGKFAVWGNRDYGGGSSRHYEGVMSGAGIRLLRNEDTVVLTPGGKKIWIGGADDSLLGQPSPQTLGSEVAEDADYRILLTHEPDSADDYSGFPIDLILSGHSHGGQVDLPFFPGVTTSMAEKYTSGFYPLNNSWGTLLYVNTGIGTSHIPVRLFVPPEIDVFDIHM